MKTDITKWWDAKSMTFKGYTHGEVILTHVVIIGLLMVCGLAEWIGG